MPSDIATLMKLPRSDQVAAVAKIPADYRDAVIGKMFSPLLSMGFKADVASFLDGVKSGANYFVPESRYHRHTHSSGVGASALCITARHSSATPTTFIHNLESFDNSHYRH